MKPTNALRRMLFNVTHGESTLYPSHLKRMYLACINTVRPNSGMDSIHPARKGH